MYYHSVGTWNRKKTYGDVPEKPYWSTTATVINNCMLVIGGYGSISTVVHSLNLETWRWTSITPGGTSPLPNT